MHCTTGSYVHWSELDCAGHMHIDSQVKKTAKTTSCVHTLPRYGGHAGRKHALAIVAHCLLLYLEGTMPCDTLGLSVPPSKMHAVSWMPSDWCRWAINATLMQYHALHMIRPTMHTLTRTAQW